MKQSTIFLVFILVVVIALAVYKNHSEPLAKSKDVIQEVRTTTVPIVPVPASNVTGEQLNPSIKLPVNQIDIFDIPNEIVNKWGGLTVKEEDLARSLGKLGNEQDLVFEKSLAAIIANPTAYTADYLDNKLDGLYKLTVNMSRLKWILAGRSNSRVASWTIFNESLLRSNSYLDTSITNLAKRAASVPGCELVDMQINLPSNEIKIPEIFWYEYSLAKIESPEKYSCGAMPYTWLLKDDNWKKESARFANLRKYVGNEEYSSMHHELLGLAPLCDKSESVEPIKYLGICDWKTDPIDLGAAKRLPLSKKKRFAYYPINAEGGTTFNIESLTGEIAQQQVGGVLGDTLHQLHQYGQIYLRGYWVNNEKTLVVFQLDCALDFDKIPRPSYVKPSKAGIEYIEPSVMGGNNVTFLLSVTKNKSQFVVINQSFGQYDDGSIEAVSDIDNDGNIEVWFSGVFGECDGEDSVPGKNCSIPQYFKTEQFGRRLGNFIQGPRPRSSNANLDNKNEVRQQEQSLAK